MRKKLKSKKGITLIALVITIIALLILAGVAIATISGNSSIIENSNKVAEAYNTTANEDEALLGKLENKLKEYTGGGSNTPTTPEEPTTPPKDDTTGITAATIVSDASYIGKYVNYTVPNGGDPNVKWRIFYADSSNIYLIASDYLKYDYVPTKVVSGTTYKMTKIGFYTDTGYRLNFNDMYKAYSSNTCSTNITDARIKKWMKYVDAYPDSKNENISSVAYMLDKEIWNSKYKNSYADYAIGGPTIEMFCKSYKATHPDKYIEATISDSNGYKVKWNTDSSYSIDISGLSTSELNNLYVIDDSKANAMWLASPSAGSSGYYLINVYYDGRVYSSLFNSFDYLGLRTLVCLNANVQLVPNGDVYNLAIKQ